MTRETAIALLNNLRAFAEDDDEPAIDMAIEALKARDVVEKLTQDLADKINDAYDKGYKAAKREIAQCGQGR